MAEGVEKFFRQNKAYGGYSDDPFLGIDGSFWRAVGLEIRQFPRTLRLQKTLIERSAGNIEQEIMSYAVLSNGIKLMGGVSGGDGKIYYQASGSTTWTLGYTHAGSGTIYGICEFNGYVYWVNDANLHRTALSDVPGFAAVTTGYQALSASVAAYKPMIEAFNKLYVGNGRYLEELNSAGTWTPAKLTLPSDDVIRNISFSGTLIKMFCRKSVNTNDTGWIYFWNGVSAAYQERTRLDGIFHCGTVMENTDYFLAGLDPYLYRLDGLTPVKVKKIPTRDSTYTATTPNYVDIAATAMTNLNGIIYFGTGLSVSIGGVGAHYIEKGIWSFGRLNENYPYSLTLEWPSTLVSSKLHKVNAVFAAEGVLNIVGKPSTATYHAYHVDTSKFQDSGELESRVFDGGEGWQIKDVVRMALAFYQLAAGEKIEVYVKPNLDPAGYGSAVLTAQYSDTADRTVTYKHLPNPFTGKEFNQFQVKLKLTCGTSNATTPVLNDFNMGYNDIKEM